MMDIGSIIDLGRSLPESVTLKPGDLLSVKVLEVFENQRALVDIGRLRTLADITFPVAAGDELRVQVVESGGRLRLQLIPASLEPAPPTGSAGGPVPAAAGEVFKQIREHIDKLSHALQHLPDAQPLPVEIRRIADALRLFLEPLDPLSGPGAIASKLRELCEDSGLFLEHRLAAAVRRAGGGAGEGPVPEAASTPAAERILSTDFKSRLLFLKDFFDGAAGRQLVQDNRETAGLARAAAEVLADLRGRQELMAQPEPHPSPFQMVHFALPMPGDRGRANLKIAYGRRRGDAKEEGYRAALLLELDRMGGVRADLTLLSASLTVAVFVSNAELRDLVERHACEVREALSPFFENVTFRVSVSARKIARFVTEDWRPADRTQVDVRI